MRRKKRKLHDDHVNNERWLVSYADFLTLLFAFFVVMYSMSPINEGQFRIFSDAVKLVFNDKVKLPDLTPPKEKEFKQKAILQPEDSTADKQDPLELLAQQLTTTLSPQINSEEVKITQGEGWLELEINSSVLFYSGESRLAKEAVPLISKIVNILDASNNPIQVEGFTDNQPINTPRFPSNWALSAARASSVVYLLEQLGITPDRMSAIGYGEFKPIADNSTATGRQKNRRVVLVILDKPADRKKQASNSATN